MIPLVLTIAVSAADVGIHNQLLGSGLYGSEMTTQVIPNNNMKDTMQIVMFCTDSGLWIKSISQTIENETRE